MEKREMKEEIKKMIIESLELDVELDEFTDEIPLFDGGLELDSVEVLEIVVGLERLFNIKIKDLEDQRKDFYNVNSLVNMVDRYIAQKTA